MSIQVFGANRREGRLLDHVLISNTVPVVAGPRSIEYFRGLGLQLITSAEIDTVPLSSGAASSVVGGTKTFTIPGYDFTGKSGATINILGAANAGNNGNHVISSVTSAHVVVATADTTDVTETFDPGAVQIQVYRTDLPALAGSWKVEVSNTWSPGMNSDDSAAGEWSDLTPFFSPLIVTVTGPSSQPVQASPLEFRAYRVTFAPTSGTGMASVFAFAKSSAQ